MQVSKDFDGFPLCARYIFNFLNTATLKKNYQKVYDAFVEVCESAAWADKALELNKGPLVRIISNVTANACGEYDGRTAGLPADRVFINRTVAQGYEGACTNWLSFEAVVLHELVHWARFQGGQPSHFKGGEAGAAFEVKAYGTRINCGGCSAK